RTAAASGAAGSRGPQSPPMCGSLSWTNRVGGMGDIRSPRSSTADASPMPPVRWSSMRILLATAAAVLGCAAPAAAAPAGSLTQLPGKAGCFVDPTSYVAVNGCAKARAMKSPQTVVLSPDGRFAYTPSNSAQAISAFRVGSGGRLTQLAGTAGCYSSVTKGCTTAVQTV